MAIAYQDSTVTKTGDMWLLDRHVVMCGDCTKQRDMAKLVGQHKMDLVITDPPYNLNYLGIREDRVGIRNDNLSTFRFTYFLTKSFINCIDVMFNDASLYVFFCYKNFHSLSTALGNAGFNIRTELVWAKNHFALSGARYHMQHEMIFYCHKQGCVDKWYGGRNQKSLLNAKKPKKNKLHPTMKPIELLEKPLLNSSKMGDKVLDMFGGSGSTLMACELLNRTAYLMEIENYYVDVIIKRWQDNTGKEAILSSTKETFNQVSLRRRILAA